jgi:hypothetical protein
MIAVGLATGGLVKTMTEMSPADVAALTPKTRP